MLRAVCPGWPVLFVFAPGKWLWPLPVDDPLRAAADHLQRATGEVAWSNARMRAGAGALGLRMMLARGYGSLAQITPCDLQAAPSLKRQRGIDTLDAALCAVGILERSPQRGSTRQPRVERAPTSELVAWVEMPDRFRAVTALYLETYALRVSDQTPTRACATRPPTWRASGGLSPSATPSLAAVASFCPRTRGRSCRWRSSKAAPRSAGPTMSCA